MAFEGYRRSRRDHRKGRRTLANTRAGAPSRPRRHRSSVIQGYQPAQPEIVALAISLVIAGDRSLPSSSPPSTAPRVWSTLIGLSAVSGMGVGEAIGLDRDDVERETPPAV
jgi:hypothetical protein